MSKHTAVEREASEMYHWSSLHWIGWYTFPQLRLYTWSIQDRIPSILHSSDVPTFEVSSLGRVAASMTKPLLVSLPVAIFTARSFCWSAALIDLHS